MLIIKPVSEIMSRLDCCLTPADTMLDAVKIMNEKKWNTIPVVNSAGKLIGVFTRSSLYSMIMSGLSTETKINEFIKKDRGTVLEDVDSALLDTVVTTSRIGTAIVVNKKGEPVGLLTKSDAVLTYVKKTELLKEQLEKVIDTSKLGALMTDAFNKIIFVNEKGVEIIGEPAGNILNQYIKTFIPQVHMYDYEEKEIHFRVALHSSNYMVRLSKYDAANGKQGLIAMFQDVSELEQLAEELETEKKWITLLQSVIENAYDGVVMINEKEEILFISPSLVELFDLGAANIEKANLHSLLPQLKMQQVLKTGVAEVSDFLEVKGINYIVHRIPVMQDGQVIGAIGKVVYRQLHEVKELFKSAEEEERNKKLLNRKNEKSKFTFNEIITNDKQMKKLINSGIKAAKRKTTILIRGESGTGKELIAHAIHSASLAGKGPFITVNCAAIPEHLLESEFFGYEEGSFTGAKSKGKVGKFDLANGGTLFLDEVGDMSLQMQAKLLRVLQEKEFYRVGGTERIDVDVRIIAATNRPLEQMVADGSFREDLFYRLNVISFDLPPLRKRKKDILLLSESLISEINRQNGTSITSWDPLFEQALLEYNWPGNIRELRNVWERAIVFAENGKVGLEDLPDYILKAVGYDLLLQEEEEYSQMPLLERAEQLAIQKALQLADGNKSKACVLLGISRSVLYDKLKKYEAGRDEEASKAAKS